MIPQDILDEIKLREGFSAVVYKDTAEPPNPTGGYGHLLNRQERSQYHFGDTIPDNVTAAWMDQDSAHAYQDALNMTGEIGIDDPNLIRALTCAAFQLGANIPSEFPMLWKLLMAKNWQAAAADAGTTLWGRQTPVRVKDFQAALLAIGTEQVSPAAT